MQLTLRKSNERGFANHGWLKSYHSFSFADYFDPAHMAFRSLRVINEDWIAPGAGFPTHPHRDMEIFTVLVEGALEHKDSMGNGRVLRPGQIQVMSAGSGVTHSEFNPSRDEPAHLLQIWIHPRVAGLKPSYTEWNPDPAKADEKKMLIIASDGRGGAATINQNADVYRLTLNAGDTVGHSLAEGRGVWLQVIKGRVQIGNVVLEAGDACSSEEAGLLSVTAQTDTDALLFDL